MPPKKKGKKSAQLAPLPARLFSSHVASLHPTYLSTLTSPEALSDSDILAAYGLIGEDPEGKGRCRYLWKENFGEGPDGWVNGSSTSSEASKGKKGKGKAKDKAACDEAKCSDDPRCLNWLGQEHWADPEAALKTFKKNLGLTRDPSLDDRDPLLPVGLKNLAATCYINSLLQCWFQDLPFRAALYACTLPDNGKVENSPLYQLQATFAALQMSTQRVYNPEMLVKSLKLDTAEQQDAQEFSKLFMSLLDTEFRKQADPRVQTLVADEFQGALKYGTECLTCKTVSARESTFLELEITLAKRCSLEEQIGLSLGSEILSGDNQYACEPCGEKRDAERWTQLTSVPPVLHFSLLRFTFDFETMERRKSKHAIDFPLSLDMSPWVVGAAPKELMYDLKGILLHKGASAHHGHYTTQVFDVSQRKWFNFDDERVSRLTAFDEPDIYDETAAVKTSTSKPRKNKAGKGKHKADEELPPGRVRTTDAYMLIYTRSTSDARSTADPSTVDLTSPPPIDRVRIPEPPALAAHDIAEQNRRHEISKTERARKIANCELDFPVAKAIRTRLWKEFEVEEGEPFVLVPTDKIRRWILDGLEHTIGPGDSCQAAPALSTANGDGSAPAATNGSTSHHESSAVSDRVDDASEKSRSGPETPILDSVAPACEVMEGRDLELWDVADDTHFTCRHGALDPRGASRVKQISAEPAAFIQASFGEGHPGVPDADFFFGQNRLCRSCVWDMFTDERYVNAHTKALADFRDAEPAGDRTYWISKEWLNDWKKPLPDMHIPGSLEDSAPDAPGWIRDVVCEHGGLQPILNKRVQISAEAAAVLQLLFPDWTSFDAAETVCVVCREETEGKNTALQEARHHANSERAKLKSLWAHGNKHRFVTPVNGLEHVVIPADWARQWFDWVKEPIKYEHPGPVDNGVLFCEHDRPVLDVTSDQDLSNIDHVAVILEQDWTALTKFYPGSGPKLAFIAGEDSPSLSPCDDCRAVQRRSFLKTRIVVRVLDPKAHEPPVPGKPISRKQDAARAKLIESSDDEDFVVLNGRKRRMSPQVTYGGVRKSRRLEQASTRHGVFKEHWLSVQRSDDVKSIKLNLQNRLRVPTIYQHLYFNDRELDSSETIESLGIGPGDVLDLLCEDIDDDAFDLFSLTDVTSAQIRRNGRAEGFVGSGLVGFEDFGNESGGDDPAPSSDAMFDLEPMVTELATPPGVCPQCTFINYDGAEACEMCTAALGIISTT